MSYYSIWAVFFMKQNAGLMGARYAVLKSFADLIFFQKEL